MLAVCGCITAICSLGNSWKIRDTLGITALFLAQAISNHAPASVAFKSAPATCQYFLYLLKILIMIRENMSGGKKRKISEKLSNQSPKIGQFESTMNFHTAF